VSLYKFGAFQPSLIPPPPKKNHSKLAKLQGPYSVIKFYNMKEVLLQTLLKELDNWDFQVEAKHVRTLTAPSIEENQLLQALEAFKTMENISDEASEFNRSDPDKSGFKTMVRAYNSWQQAIVGPNLDPWLVNRHEYFNSIVDMLFFVSQFENPIKELDDTSLIIEALPVVITYLDMDLDFGTEPTQECQSMKEALQQLQKDALPCFLNPISGNSSLRSCCHILAILVKVYKQEKSNYPQSKIDWKQLEIDTNNNDYGWKFRLISAARLIVTHIDEFVAILEHLSNPTLSLPQP
jgi:hypothetical protein